jgi:hypothetical protein
VRAGTESFAQGEMAVVAAGPEGAPG